MKTSDIMNDAQLIWDYHKLKDTPVKSDLIMVLGSNDPRVAQRGAQLFLEGYAKKLLFSGGVGELTQGQYGMSEADFFAKIALEMGVPEESILIEKCSTNTGENLQFSIDLLKRQKIHFSSVILVQKPFMERRSMTVFKKYLPSVKLTVTSPLFDLLNYTSPEFPFDPLVNVMIGDLQRIKDYPALGFQIPQEIPDTVLKAASRLITLGYHKHLINGKSSF